MGKSKKLQALSQKKDFDRLRNQAQAFSYRWLKAFFLYEREAKTLKLAWSLPKKSLADSVTRNRLKRWGRENFKKKALKGGLILMAISQKDKNFYKKLKRKDFDHVFNCILEKL